MPLSKEQKKEQLEKLAEKMKKAESVVFTSLSQISVADQTTLRNTLLDNGAELTVVKKSLIKLASKEIGVESLNDESINGQIAVALSYEEATSAPQMIKKLKKTISNLELKGGIFEGKELSVQEVKELANLPTKEVLYAKFLGTLNGPVQGFVSASSGVMSSFVRVLNGYKDQLEANA